MMPASREPEVISAWRDGVLRVTLNRPGRGNSLTPAMLGTLCDVLEQAGSPRAVVITGHGRCFSSGGDVGEIHRHATGRDSLEAYCTRLVGTLNRAILALLALPCPVIAAVNGPITGGALGLAVAADIVVMARSAFIQPYYARMGFAPDGGWTAVLPGRIGTARTASWLALDARVSAEQALAMGLADALVEDEGLDAHIDTLLAGIADHDPLIALTTRRLLGRTGKKAGHLADRLEAERLAFLDHVIRPETLQRMVQFLGGARLGVPV